MPLCFSLLLLGCTPLYWARIIEGGGYKNLDDGNELKYVYDLGGIHNEDSDRRSYRQLTRQLRFTIAFISEQNTVTDAEVKHIAIQSHIGTTQTLTDSLIRSHFRVSSVNGSGLRSFDYGPIQDYKDGPYMVRWSAEICYDDGECKTYEREDDLVLEIQRAPSLN